MGFPEEKCRETVIVQGLNLSAAAAVLAGVEDADGHPVEAQRQASSGVAEGETPPTHDEVLASFESMGFSKERSEAALKETGGDVERALQALLEQGAKEEGGA